MKSSISYLPQEKQQELQSITEAIVEQVHPEMIILFGSYSRGDWVDDTYKENGTITGKPQAKEGTMLYESGKHQLAAAKELSPIERANKAKIYYDAWFKIAEEFFIDYNNPFNRSSYPKAAFELHQAAENLYKTIILVFTDYKPKTHDLEDLNKQVGYADARFKFVFANQSDEDKRRYTILVKAYIDSRYKLDYAVDPDDLIWLAVRVGKLKELAEVICSEKIDQYLK